MHQHPLKWHLMIILGNPATRPTTPPRVAGRTGTGGRGNADTGSVEARRTSPTRVVNFDPLVLPAGISAVGRSVAERPVGGLFAIVYEAGGREAEPSAITPADIRK